MEKVQMRKCAFHEQVFPLLILILQVMSLVPPFLFLPIYPLVSTVPGTLLLQHNVR